MGFSGIEFIGMRFARQETDELGMNEQLLATDLDFPQHIDADE